MRISEQTYYLPRMYVCVFIARLPRTRAIVSTTRTTRSYRSRERPHGATPPSPESRNVLVQFQCLGFGGTGDASFVLSVSSRRGDPRSEGGHKDPKRVVPPAREGGWHRRRRRRRLKKVGPRVCRMPKLPLKHDARTPSQTARLQLTLPSPRASPSFSSRPSPPLPCFSHGWPASSKSPYRASDSGTRSIILDMASPGTRAHRYVTNPPVTPRPVDQYAVEVTRRRSYTIPRPLLPANPLTREKMPSS